jgi:hypothetical protein
MIRERTVQDGRRRLYGSFRRNDTPASPATLETNVDPEDAVILMWGQKESQ